jgi:tRNA (Thr-GGU) A37 N-methylase
LIEPARRKLRKVHPMGRKDLPLQGIFATCSPARPNPVLVSAVPLVAREKNVLKVRGFEAVDGSPIIDIKPYSKSYLQATNLTMPAWMEQIHRELADESD